MNKETLDHLELCIFAEQTHDINFHNIAKELFREVYFQKNIVDQLTNNWNELERSIYYKAKYFRDVREPKKTEICLDILNKMKEIKGKNND